MVVRRPADELSRVGLELSVRDSHRRADELHYSHEYAIDEPYIVVSILMVKPTHER